MTEGIIQIDQELCTGCRVCATNCPGEAIQGELHKQQTVDEERCLGCGRCTQLCNAYDSVFDTHATSRAARLQQRALPASLTEPLFAVYDRNSIAEVKAALADTDLFSMTQCHPAALAAIAEDFGLPAGSVSPGQVVAALKRLGFDKVEKTDLPAACALLEAAHELIERLDGGRILPVIDSSCPAVVKFIEQSYPELIHRLCSCKSPHQIAGALFKSYGAEIAGKHPASVYSVSIVPCTSRKLEANRPEMKAESGEARPDVDAVLTTRELAYLIKEDGIGLAALTAEKFDQDLPEIPGVGKTYCAAGDITRAVLHTGCELLGNGNNGKPQIEFAALGEGVQVGRAQLGNHAVEAVVVSGLKNAIPFLEDLRAGKNSFAFMELRACPQACVSGGGQPKVLLSTDRKRAYDERARVVFSNGETSIGNIAKHPAVQQLYQCYFAKPCGDKSNHILHTQYVERRLSR